ncbi:MAG: selenobiotic family peptide radical SAM maturase [Deltaproteobacteria bacterium]|nr:selenobiotic family peptide radical SAM maturase [Deltaproteobacteria bacterium]
MTSKISDIFPLSCSLLGVKAWQRLLKGAGDGMQAATLPDFLERQGGPGIPRFLSGLARIELARSIAAAAETSLPSGDTPLILNPSLRLVSLDWKGLAPLFTSSRRRDLSRVRPGAEIVLVWREPGTGGISTRVAEAGDLLAIKLVVEEIAPEDAAREAGVPVGNMDAVLREAVRKGIVLSPPSRLRREAAIAAGAADGRFLQAEVFTLQWHLTQECDLHCRHCYDRSHRREFPFERAVSLLDELRGFCRTRFAAGQVSLSGGNPLLFPHFFDLYRAAADRGFMIAILGNAADRAAIERIMGIRTPVYYQVSLEGLEAHNDEIRGAGNFRRTKEFLRMLTGMGVPNMVMLTLTRDNIGQVIPLAEELEGITGGLTFNRLAQFGEGAALQLPTMEAYRSFLSEYAAALETHPVLTLKDSLLNIIFEQENSSLFGGCAGHGCGAAFNFVSILSDGEVHACRKFPSPIGNIIAQSLEEVYASAAAHRYRAGSTACSGCRLRAVCGGCMAVTQGMGLDPFNDRDPFCFRHHA